MFQAAIDTSPLPTFVVDGRDRTILHANPSAANLLDRGVEDVVGRGLIDFAPGLAESADPVSPTWSPAAGPASMLSGDAAIPVEITVQRLQAPGRSVRYLIVARDLREFIEAQRTLVRLARDERARAFELRAIIESMVDAVAVFDGDGHLLLGNPALDRVAPALPPVTDYSGLLAALEPTRDLPELGTSSQPVSIRTGSTERWLQLTYSAISSTDVGSLSAVSTVVVIRDITAQREEQAAREAFVGILSHELRTPVTTILGDAKLLARRQPFGANTEAAELLGDIEAEAERLYRLVEDLLVLSRAERQSLAVRLEPILLQRVVDQIVATERRRWPDVTILVERPRDLAPVAADATYVEQVLRNLIGNAAKYSPRPATVRVVVEDGGDNVTTRVLDDGPAFAPEEADRLFELFYRSHATEATQAGAGIGLYVSRVLVETMGGRIWAAVRPEGGAEFAFSIPEHAELTDLLEDPGRAP